MDTIRINKYLTMANYCSRRQADALIAKKQVKINDKIAQLGDQVEEYDNVFVKGKLVEIPSGDKVYLAFNKPVGVICTTLDKQNNNIIDYIDYPVRIYPVGRLDVNSSGLILLTNDGSIVNKILKSSGKIEKEYIVTVNKKISQQFLKRMRAGVCIFKNYQTKPAKVKKNGDKKFSIIITEGKNRQIRRMCQKLGYLVNSLTRIRIGNLVMQDLPRGKYIELDRKIIEEQVLNRD